MYGMKYRIVLKVQAVPCSAVFAQIHLVITPDKYREQFTWLCEFQIKLIFTPQQASY